MNWKKIESVEPCGRIDVVAIKTASGTYKTRHGMSHNCDDL